MGPVLLKCGAVEYSRGEEPSCVRRAVASGGRLGDDEGKKDLYGGESLISMPLHGQGMFGKASRRRQWNKYAEMVRIACCICLPYQHSPHPTLRRRRRS